MTMAIFYIQCVCVCVCVALLGIQDLSRLDYGDAVELQPGDVTVFWACGVTAIEAILSSSEHSYWLILCLHHSLQRT